MQIISDPDLPEDENPQEEPEVYAVHWQGGKAKISRRNLLKAGGVLMAGAALAGCAPEEETTIEPEPTNSPVPTATSTPTPTPEPTRAVQDWDWIF